MTRRNIASTATVVSAFLAALLPGVAMAAPAAPAWELNLTTMPTNFVAGSNTKPFPQYTLIATNVGGATAHGPISIEDTLPAGLTVSSQAPPYANDQRGGNGSSLPCGIVDQTVTCTDPGPVDPGQYIVLQVPVEVGAFADPSTVLDQAGVSGGGAPPAATTTTTTISTSLPLFDFLAGPFGFGMSANQLDGAAATQAGAHPHQVNINLGLPTKIVGQTRFAAGTLRDLEVDLPRGMVVNPAAAPRCKEVQLESLAGCPDATQIGLIDVPLAVTSVTPQNLPLYNMVPPPGSPAEFGVEIQNVPEHILGGLKAGEFRLSGGSSDLLAQLAIFNAQVQLWGSPSDESHDQVRGLCGEQRIGNEEISCPVDRRNIAFLTMPTSCAEAPDGEISADSWEEPGLLHSRHVPLADLEGNPIALDGCNQLEYEPRIEARPTTNLAESPSGLDFTLHQPQDEELEHNATATLKDITVTLPEGMTLNPAAAAGIDGCSISQAGLVSAIGQSPVRLDGKLPGCPDASRLGTVEVTSPVLAQEDAEGQVELDPETGDPIPDPLQGSVYLAKPFENPFGSLLAVYLAIEDPHTGIVAKLAGKVSADPKTGRLVTSFEEGPELPIEDVRVHLFGGARGPLITPPLCGTHTTTATLTPWSSPAAPDAHASDSFQTSAFPGGGSCPTSAAQAPKDPAFSAGTVAPVAGAYSPFVLKVSREDGSQRLTGVDTTLPPGLIGKLAGLSKCSEGQIAAAEAREAPERGRAELASPSCPASSEVGSVDVGAGAGPTPFYVRAHAYLAGPYKGAPLSIAIVSPAVAGPFDLGTVVTRVALFVDARSVQIHAVSDPIPTFLEGIPLDIRSAVLKMDRPDFTLNPTSCEPMAIVGHASTEPGGVATLRSPFQVGGCSALGFKPRLALRLEGGTRRGRHPAFRAVYRPEPGDANVKGLVVRLPRSAFLDQAHIRTICTRVQFSANACPAGARYGYITAWTPLLDEPLQGPVYLRSSDHKLPDLVFDLRGEVGVEVATRVDSIHGGIRASIESAPDAPLSKVLLRMQGGNKGLIVNSRNICKHEFRATAALEGQNGKAYDTTPLLRDDCKKTTGQRGRGSRR